MDRDDIATMSIEQLVDAMDLDGAWCDKHLADQLPGTRDLVQSLIRGKMSRIDYFSTNKVNCFITNEEEAEKLQTIPGIN